MVGRRPGPTIGILALQGAVREHQRAVERLGAPALAVKKVEELALIDGLIIPGGESTTIGKLMEAYGFLDAVRRRAAEGMAILGTCAGLILLAKGTVEGGGSLLGLMDIKARRNAFGRQIDSCETEIKVGVLREPPFPAVFIRAPWIEETGRGVRVLAGYGGRTVLAEQGRFLACAFHPELTEDLRLHRYFLETVMNREVVCPAIQNGQR